VSCVPIGAIGVRISIDTACTRRSVTVVPRTIRARRGPADRTSRPAPRRGGGGRGRAAAPHFARVRAIAQRAPIGPTMVRTKSC